MYNGVDISHFQHPRRWSDAPIYYIFKMSARIQRYDNKHPNEHFQFIFPQKCTDNTKIVRVYWMLSAPCSWGIRFYGTGSVGDNIITSLCRSWLSLFRLEP